MIWDALYIKCAESESNFFQDVDSFQGLIPDPDQH